MYQDANLGIRLFMLCGDVDNIRTSALLSCLRNALGIYLFGYVPDSFILCYVISQNDADDINIGGGQQRRRCRQQINEEEMREEIELECKFFDFKTYSNNVILSYSSRQLV